MNKHKGTPHFPNRSNLFTWETPRGFDISRYISDGPNLVVNDKSGKGTLYVSFQGLEHSY